MSGDLREIFLNLQTSSRLDCSRRIVAEGSRFRFDAQRDITPRWPRTATLRLHGLAGPGLERTAIDDLLRDAVPEFRGEAA
jgi:hypothetical protein